MSKPWASGLPAAPGVRGGDVEPGRTPSGGFAELVPVRGFRGRPLMDLAPLSWSNTALSTAEPLACRSIIPAPIIPGHRKSSPVPASMDYPCGRRAESRMSSRLWLQWSRHDLDLEQGHGIQEGESRILGTETRILHEETSLAHGVSFRARRSLRTSSLVSSKRAVISSSAIPLCRHPSRMGARISSGKNRRGRCQALAGANMLSSVLMDVFGALAHPHWFRAPFSALRTLPPGLEFACVPRVQPSRQNSSQTDYRFERMAPQRRKCSAWPGL